MLLIQVEGNQVSEIGFEIPNPDESGRSKRKRVPRQVADALNGCLCGLVLDVSVSGVLKCKQAGCETQWVSSHTFKLIGILTHIMCLVSPPMCRT
jgi:hypothetical protein